MDFSNLVAGVSPGGFQDIYEVRILICYLLHAVNQPLTKDQLNHIFREQNLVQYFTFSDALAKLIAEKHVKVEEDENEEFYTLTPLGEGTAHMLQNSLPRSVRDRVVTATVALLQQQKTERENKVDILPNDHGFEVCFLIQDNGFDLMKFSLFVPDLTQAEMVKARFLQDPLTFYQRMIGYLVFGMEEYPANS